MTTTTPNDPPLCPALQFILEGGIEEIFLEHEIVAIAADVRRLIAERAAARADLAKERTRKTVEFHVTGCTFNLQGAGYSCLYEDAEQRIGALDEGPHVMFSGRHVSLHNLHILGPVAVAEMRGAVKAEQAIWTEAIETYFDATAVMDVEGYVAAIRARQEGE